MTTSTSANHYPIASLYVGDLAPEVTEAVLFEKFSIAGPVLSIRVCRDIITRRSLGYAYVNYQNTGDAERAIDTLNFEKLGNRPIRIMWSQRDPSLRRSGVGNIFIKNLERTVDNKVLFDTFSVFGNILSCKVSYDDKSSSKGYGFVHYDSEEAAQEAIENLNNRVILGKKIYVGKFLSRKERECKHGGSRRFTNVYVKNLPDEYNNDDKLKALFDPYGEITSAVVAVDEEGKSKGFGFVCFMSTEGAEGAVDALNGKDFGNGKPLYVGRAQKKAERDAELRRKLDMLKMDRINRSQGVNLYVKNLEDTINDERLQKEFSAFGTITSAKVMTDDKGRSKGFGFVCFSTPEEATKAVTEMNNRIIVTKPLYVALAQRKEDREAQKINLRFAQPAMPRMPPPAGNHPHHPLGAQMGFAGNAATGPLAIQGLQGLQSQAVHAGHAGAPTQYLVPIAPNAQLHQRNIYPNAAGFQGGAPGQQTMRGNPRWNNVNQMNRSGQVGGPGQYNPNNRGSGIQRNPNQQPNVARQTVFPAGVPNGPGATGPVAGRPFVQGQNMPVNPNGAPVQRGPVRPPANVGMNRGANKPQPMPMSHPILHDASSSEDQSQILGEKLFPHVHKLQPENAGKITGMLLEMDVPEILHMIDNPDNIKPKVDEAVAVLQAHHAKEMAAKKE